MAGWIKWYRQSELCEELQVDKFDELHAFLWMVEKANTKPYKSTYRGKTTTIKRGQFKTSIRKLAETFGWSKDKVERFLEKTETHKMLTTTRDRNGTLITIENYTKYQGRADTNKDTNKDKNAVTGKPLYKNTEEKEKNKTAKTSEEVRRPMTKEEIYAAELEEMGPADEW